jgi:hypothetical protein
VSKSLAILGQNAKLGGPTLLQKGSEVHCCKFNFVFRGDDLFMHDS